MVTTSHLLNHDGYFRKVISNPTGKGRGTHKMFHRHVWESTHGEIPDGYEIDHKCKNRACCNIQHLQMLEGTVHTILTNTERYSERKTKAKEYWLHTACTGYKLSKVFEVSVSVGYRWLKEWKPLGLSPI